MVDPFKKREEERREIANAKAWRLRMVKCPEDVIRLATDFGVRMNEHIPVFRLRRLQGIQSKEPTE